MATSTNRVSLYFTQISDDELMSFSGGVVTGMSAPAFADAPVKTGPLTALHNDFVQKVTLALNGGKIEIAERNVARAALIAALRQNAAFVQMIAGTNLPLLLDSGYKPTSTTKTTGPLRKPVITNVDNYQSTMLMLATDADDRSRAQEARYRVGDGAYQNGGVHTKATRILVEPLVPGTTYQLQTRSVGGTTGYSDWSDPVSHMAT